jgi:predicted 2-oxoglutarate/Fe(II)-dependent dioxygenase YbiX
VYQGPSGFFKSHVDTPRGKTQFGSLVLCLPSPHEGGRLTVTHGGLSQAFDWDKQGGAKALQWAAFYSDCEHEVSPVTSGHRVTVTYNLHYELRAQDKHNPLSGLDRKPAPIDITSLPPYGILHKLLQNPEWMKDGK